MVRDGSGSAHTGPRGGGVRLGCLFFESATTSGTPTRSSRAEVGAASSPKCLILKPFITSCRKRDPVGNPARDSLSLSDMSRLLSGQTLLRRLSRVWRGSDPIDPAREVLIVRRGMSPAYYFCLEKFAVANNVDLVKDRRVDSRRRSPLRVAAERSNDDRRAPPPATWAKGDVVVIRPDTSATD